MRYGWVCPLIRVLVPTAASKIIREIAEPSSGKGNSQTMVCEHLIAD
jgi:hypothetical protein